MKLYRIIAVLAASLIFSACSSLGGAGMSADQLKALAADKSSAAACIDSIGPGWKISTLIVNNDKTFGSAGGRTSIECAGGKVTFEDSGKADAKPKVSTP